MLGVGGRGLPPRSVMLDKNNRQDSDPDQDRVVFTFSSSLERFDKFQPRDHGQLVQSTNGAGGRACQMTFVDTGHLAMRTGNETASYPKDTMKQVTA